MSNHWTNVAPKMVRSKNIVDSCTRQHIREHQQHHPQTLGMKSDLYWNFANLFMFPCDKLACVLDVIMCASHCNILVLWRFFRIDSPDS